jgi:hypothetical protein
MTERAGGTLTTAFEPLSSDDEWIGRMRVRKTIEGELTGLTGSFDIVNEAGVHSYTFDYDLS